MSKSETEQTEVRSTTPIRAGRPDFHRKQTNSEHPFVERPTPKDERPRWVLHIQAEFWRALMGIGMFMHRLAPPRPMHPAFTKKVKATISPSKGNFELFFYVPRDYKLQKNLKRKRYPVVVNFHGGGYTLGTATDDARWAQCVVNEVQAVLVSVNYRLAPENCFPTPVEDGVDAIKYITENCEDLLVDPDRMAISGFSSGGNMTFTVPLRAQSERIMVPARKPLSALTSDGRSSSNESNNTSTPSSSLPPDEPPSPRLTPGDPSQPRKSKDLYTIAESHELQIKALCAWYPPTDYTVTREERRATCLRKDQELPAMFTSLFDESYLQPPTLDMANPYLSPCLAPKMMLEKLPQDVILYTCEWDMLLAEGERMRDRLRNEFKKNVVYKMVPGVPHGWDKAPNPIKVTPGVWNHYRDACRELRRVLKPPKGSGGRQASFASYFSRRPGH